jgi:phosphatidylethanolamine-binding protein (PEBP) family uncharacterized protein
VLILDDPDASTGRFIHWLAWGITPDVGGLSDGELAPLEVEDLRLAPGAGVWDLELALASKVLAVAELVGTYGR